MPSRRPLQALAPVLAVLLLAALVAPAAGKPDRSELDKLLAETDAIAEKVAKLRGLAIKKPIKRGVMARAEIESRVLTRIDEEYSVAKLAGEEAAAKRFGLLPHDADYKQMVISLLGEQIAGFYDPVAKELYLADWIDVASQRIVMAHEIDHALQDQHFDLQKFHQAVKADSDAALARQALVEGDGVALMIEYVFAETGMKNDPWADDALVDAMAKQTAGGLGMEAFDKAPLYLKESLMFPYVSGLRLIAKTRRLNSWSRVDEMFKKPPQSTEHVLHPEKYFAGEKVVKVKAPALPALKKWKRLEENVLGEAAFGWLFRQHGVREQRALDAAAGWGGDRFAVFAPPAWDGKDLGALLLVHVSVWDTETDADEAFAALAESLPVWLGGPTPSEKTAELIRFTEKSGASAWVTKKGKRVVLVLGHPADKAYAKLAKDIDAKWK